jgi:hypothetical protein
MSAITYTGKKPISGPKFTCPRCQRVHAFPVENGKPIRCECSWWYRNVGHGHIVEEFKTRLGGAKF